MPVSTPDDSDEGAAAHKTRWRYGLLAALPVLLLALYPQISFRHARGQAWNGATVHAHGDEVVYGAYLNALIDGRPRRSDPYTGRDEAPNDAAPAESYFSIQFVPAYALAMTARLLGASTSQAFAALTVFCAVASTLAVFWLLSLVTGDSRAASFGSVIVLCLGSILLVARFALTHEASNNHLSFLRRYLPSAPFPLFFLFCALVWLMLSGKVRRASVLYAAGAGLAFALLVYSYFYLWTTAAAWLLCLTLLWVSAHGKRGTGRYHLFAVVGVLAASALLPYFILISRRAASTDEGLLLTSSHSPDVFRLPELIGALVLAILFLVVRRRLLPTRSPALIFTAAFALTPFVVFNQQVVTGRSLQPFHYEMFIANYVAVLAAVLCASLLRSVVGPRAQRMVNTLLPAAALIALASGALETVLAAKRFRPSNELRDEAHPSAVRLAGLGRVGVSGGLDTSSHVLVTNMTVSDTLPTVAPQPVLWAPHMFNFPGVTLEEDKRRLAAFMYYTGVDLRGVDENRFDELDGRTRYYVSSLIGRSRHNPALTVNWKPISPEEVRGALDYYGRFVESFDAGRATLPTLSYVLMSEDDGVDLTNLDRWYERDSGERMGRFTLYRVKPRAVSPS